MRANVDQGTWTGISAVIGAGLGTLVEKLRTKRKNGHNTCPWLSSNDLRDSLQATVLRLSLLQESVERLTDRIDRAVDKL